MGDEHLHTIPEMESEEFIKSSVENLVQTQVSPRMTVSVIDNESFSDEDILKEIYSNPLFDEEIISMKIDPYNFNVVSDLIESLLNQNSLIIYSSSKINFLLDEFIGELILLKSIPSGIDETDFDLEEEIRLIKILLYDNSSPRIEEDDYDSEMDMLILEELLSNDSFSLSKNESFHFDIPSSSFPPMKPPDDDSGILTVKVMGDISKHNVPMPRLFPTQPTHDLNPEKLLISYLIKALKLSSFLLKD
nr:hypothetical protein [Tanacetum cinerariifolium]